MKNYILYISILLLIAIGCGKKYAGKKKYIETDWYKLNLHEGCIGGYVGSRGGSTSYDSCSSAIKIRQFVNLPFSDKYYTGRFATVIVNEPIDSKFSYSLEIRKDTFDSLVKVYGGSQYFQPLLDSIVLKELKEFLNIKVTIKDSLILTYNTVVEDTARLASHRVADKYPENGTHKGTSGGGRFGFEHEQEWGSLFQLTDAVASVVGHPIRWLNDSLKYNTSFSFTPETENPWEELQKEIKEEFGLVFIKDSVELEFVEIEFLE